MFGWVDLREDGKKKKVKNRRENKWKRCSVERGRGKRKVVGPTNFLSSPFKIQSLQIGEKIGVKSGKNIWTKLLPPLLTYFFFNTSFLFLFSFFFLWFCQVVGSPSFLSFYFFFIFFFRKTLLDDCLYYFLKCSLSSIHNFFLKV